MVWDGSTLVNLSDVLADLYEDQEQSRRVVKGVGLRAAMIKFHPAATVNWFNIVDHANKQGQLEDLVDFALRENPRSQPLALAQKRGVLSCIKGPDIRTAIAWGGPTGEGLEKLVSGEDALVDVSFLEVGLRRSQAVARVGLPSGWYGSGFLTVGRLFVTNHHILPDPATAAVAEAQFDYRRTPDGAVTEPVCFRFDPGRYFRTSSVAGGDDWTVVGLAGEPEERFAPLELSEVEITAGERVNIIQHPMGQPKQMSFFHNFVAFVGGDRVQYLTDTLPGSSGSPVFDKHWRVVAVHHSGGLLKERGSATGAVSYRNEGIHIHAVMRGMRAATAGK